MWNSFRVLSADTVKSQAAGKFKLNNEFFLFLNFPNFPNFKALCDVYSLVKLVKNYVTYTAKQFCHQLYFLTVYVIWINPPWPNIILLTVSEMFVRWIFILSVVHIIKNMFLTLCCYCNYVCRIYCTVCCLIIFVAYDFFCVLFAFWGWLHYDVFHIMSFFLVCCLWLGWTVS